MATEREERARILLVDGGVENIEALFSALGNDYNLILAANGSDAEEVVRSDRPALLIINHHLPDMDGYELSRRLADGGTTAGIPRVMLIPSSDPKAEARGFASGATDFITLPFDAVEARQSVARQLELMQCREEREQFRGLDPLTALASRQRFDAQLENEWLRGVRSARSLSLLLLDIDDFSAYNSHYGEQAGNDCLKHIAHIIEQELHRSSDRAARFHLDQFACILPDTEREGALLLAEKLRGDIDRHHLEHTQSSVADHITVSIGVASMTPTSDVSMTDLLNAARRYLNEAKRHGGNRVMGSEQDPLPPEVEP